jgi:prepilin signal peptidase PulO-like enzyme (type II secretory pathway)
MTVLWVAVAAALAPRLPRSLSWWSTGPARPVGRGAADASRCPRCAAPVRTCHVLPVVGFVPLRGRCRMCRVGTGAGTWPVS